MTKKDYELLARVFKEARLRDDRYSRTSSMATIMDLQLLLERALEAEYPKFDRMKFVSACMPVGHKEGL